MDVLSNYYDSLTETDLTYLKNNTIVVSLLEIPKLHKQRRLHQKQLKFIQVLKVLRENQGRKDKEGVEIVTKLTSICRKFVREIYKIKKAAELCKESVSDYYEFLELEMTQREDLFQLIEEEYRHYQRVISVSISPEDVVKDIFEKNKEALTEVILWDIEDNWSKEIFESKFDPFLKDKGLKIV